MVANPALMIAHTRLDCTCKAEHQSVGVDFDIRCYPGNWFNTPSVYRGYPQRVQYMEGSTRKVVYAGMCFVQVMKWNELS